MKHQIRKSSEMTLKEMLDNNQNRSVEDINRLYKDICSSIGTSEKEDLLRECIRHFLSRNLMDYNENNKLWTSIILDVYEQGTSELEKPVVVAIWQQESEGIIWLDIEAYCEPMELDDIELKEQVQIVNELFSPKKC